MSRLARLAGQGLVYLAFAVLLGVFANGPSYTHLPADQAMIKLSFAHGGSHKQACRRRTAEEIAALPPNMRKVFDCPRERVAVLVELRLDGDELYRAELQPTGLAGDGPSRVYARFAVVPGRHVLEARLRDTPRSEGFDYVRKEVIELAPLQNFVVDFRPGGDGFVFN